MPLPLRTYVCAREGALARDRPASQRPAIWLKRRLKRRPRDQTAATALADLMCRTSGVALAAALAACTWLGPACASEPLHCGRFAQETLPSPIPQKGVHALDRVEEITRAVKSAAYAVLFFGDSLTEHWDSTVWAQSLAPRGALNAGVSGDRTDHL